MIYRLFFLLFFIMPFSGHCEAITDIETILKTKNYLKFKNYIENRKEVRECASEKGGVYRALIPNYIIGIIPFVIFERTIDCNFYRVNLLSKDNIIVHYEVFKIDYATKEEKLLSRYSLDELKSLKEDFQKVIGFSLNEEELFLRSITYGNHCGIVGINPYERDVMEKLIEERNTKELLKWIISPNYEKQLYGYEGFRAIILSSGYKPTDLEQSLLTRLKNQTGSVKTCSGCTSFSMDFKEVINQIDSSNIYPLQPEKPSQHEKKYNNELKNEMFLTNNRKKIFGVFLIICVSIVVVFLYKYQKNRNK